MRDTCELVFATSLGQYRTIRIPDPIPTLSAMQAIAAADHIITANPFDETVGSLESLRRANRVTVKRVVLI